MSSLQELLNGKGASLAVDADFGPATLQAVKNFQSSRGLTVRVELCLTSTDPASKLKLYNACLAAIMRHCAGCIVRDI